MAISITALRTIISNCDNTTNWSATGGPVVGSYTESADSIPVWGGGTGGCVGGDVDIETGVFWYDVYAANGNVSQDYTGLHVWFAMMCMTAAFLDTKANGGLGFCLQDSSGNEGYWYLDGSNTYQGGWKRHVVDCDSTPTANNGTNPTITSINKIGFRFKGVAKSKLSENCFVDDVWYHDQSTNTGVCRLLDTVETDHTWQDVYDADQALTLPLGFIDIRDGVVFLKGPFELGDTNNGGFQLVDTTGKLVVWEDTFAATDYYGILVQGSSVGVDPPTEFVLGSVSGTGNDRFGSGGGVITTAGAHKWFLTASSTDADRVELNGCVLKNSGIIELGGSGADQAISTTFDACGQVQPNGSTILNCNFLNNTETTGAVEMLDADDDNITYCLFRNCDNGVYFPSGQTATRDFVGLDFDDVGGNYDINNASGSAVTVNNTFGSNANSYNTGGSSVSFPSTVTLTFEVNDESGSPITGALAYIDDNDNTPYIMNTTTNASGIASTGHSAGAVTGARWRVRKYGYKPFKLIKDISTSDITIPVTLVADPQQT